MGGGEVVRYISRHGNGRLAKAVLVAAKDRSQFCKDLTMPFYGFNRPDAKISEGLRESFWLHGMQASVKSVYAREDRGPHARRARRRRSDCSHPSLGGSHGLAQTHAEELNRDVLSFIRTGKVA